MKKHLSFLGAVLTAGMLSAPAYAADSSYYVSGNVGLSSFSDTTVKNHTTQVQQGTLKTDSGLALLGAVGVKFDCWRAEAEVGYQRGNVKEMTNNSITTAMSGNISVTSLLANGYYDLSTGGINPYLTAGIGLASVGANSVGPASNPGNSSESHSVLGYQFGAGIVIPLSKSIDLDVRYRYLGTGNVTNDDKTSEFKLSGSDFLVGVRIGL